MKTIEFIQAKLASFNVELSDVELKALLVDNGISEADNYETKAAKTAMVGIIPELLLKPQISEGDLSIKYDSNAIINYYNLLCTELGIENKLNPTPKIRNRTNRW